MQYVDWFVRSFGWFEDDIHVYLSMEYLEHGDLRNFLVSSLPEREACEIASQLVEGLDAMHRNNFVHRDLKPAASHPLRFRRLPNLMRRQEHSSSEPGPSLVGQDRRLWYKQTSRGGLDCLQNANWHGRLLCPRGYGSGHSISSG